MQRDCWNVGIELKEFKIILKLLKFLKPIPVIKSCVLVGQVFLKTCQLGFSVCSKLSVFCVG